MNKEEINKAILTLEVLIDCNKEDGTYYNAQKEWEALEVFKKLQQKVNQLETNRDEAYLIVKEIYDERETTGRYPTRYIDDLLEILERGKE